MLAGMKKLLGHHLLYVTLQRAVGADRLRYRCLEELALNDGDTVIDVGCGPAYYFHRLPAVRYVGFDTSPHYIAHAQRRFGSDRAEFRCEIFGEEHLSQLPPADAILLLGLLHHLSDEQSRKLLEVSAAALAPGGRVISVDPCFEPNQGRISHWMSANDRGEYVRTPDAFVALADGKFEDIGGEILDDVTRIPSSHWMMRLRKPVAGR